MKCVASKYLYVTLTFALNSIYTIRIHNTHIAKTFQKHDWSIYKLKTSTRLIVLNHLGFLKAKFYSQNSIFLK